MCIDIDAYNTNNPDDGQSMIEKGSFVDKPYEPKSPFYRSDLNLVTLILKHDLDKVKVSNHPKYEVSMSYHSKVIARADTQIVRNLSRMRGW